MLHRRGPYRPATATGTAALTRSRCRRALARCASAASGTGRRRTATPSASAGTTPPGRSTARGVAAGIPRAARCGELDLHVDVVARRAGRTRPHTVSGAPADDGRWRGERQPVGVVGGLAPAVGELAAPTGRCPSSAGCPAWRRGAARRRAAGTASCAATRESSARHALRLPEPARLVGERHAADRVGRVGLPAVLGPPQRQVARDAAARRRRRRAARRGGSCRRT